MVEKIKVNFLGTGSSVPTARRNHTALLLRFKDEMLLFDCGEGTQRQFRKSRLNASRITRIFLSHWHGDHMLGLPGLLQTMVMNGYNRSLHLYGPKGSRRKLSFLIDFFGIKPQSLDLTVHEVSGGVAFENDDFSVSCLPMDHGAPTNAYAFEIKEKSRLDKVKLKKLKIPSGPHMAQLVQGKKVKINGKTIDGKSLLYTESSRKVVFIVDSRYCDNAVKLSKDADLLICEASFAADESEIARSHGHMTSKDAATIAKKAKAKKLALIHLSQRYDAIPKKIVSEAKKVFSECFAPEDLDSTTL